MIRVLRQSGLLEGSPAGGPATQPAIIVADRPEGLTRLQNERLLPLESKKQHGLRVAERKVYLFPEYQLHCFVLLFRKKMRVAFSHFLGLVTAPGVDGSLINTLRCTVRNERVAENMPATEF